MIYTRSGIPIEIISTVTRTAPHLDTQCQVRAIEGGTNWVCNRRAGELRVDVEYKKFLTLSMHYRCRYAVM